MITAENVTANHKLVIWSLIILAAKWWSKLFQIFSWIEACGAQVIFTVSGTMLDGVSTCKSPDLSPGTEGTLVLFLRLLKYTLFADFKRSWKEHRWKLQIIPHSETPPINILIQNMFHNLLYASIHINGFLNSLTEIKFTFCFFGCMGS